MRESLISEGGNLGQEKNWRYDFFDSLSRKRNIIFIVRLDQWKPELIKLGLDLVIG
jgi:hypothetical protein